MDCSSSYGVTRDYETFFYSTGIHHDNRAHIITLELFTKFFYVLGFGLTRNREADGQHISLPRQGIVRIEARFKKLLAFSMLFFQDISRSTTPEKLK